MSAEQITRLVVGAPRTLSLGRPVGQRIGIAATNALRWRAGVWVGAQTSRLPDFLRRKAVDPLVVPATRKAAERRPAGLALAALVGLALAAPGAIWLAQRTASAPTAALPIAPAGSLDKGARLRIVNAPYEAAPAQPQLPSEPSPPLPIAAPAGASPNQGTALGDTQPALQVASTPAPAQLMDRPPVPAVVQNAATRVEKSSQQKAQPPVAAKKEPPRQEEKHPAAAAHAQAPQAPASSTPPGKMAAAVILDDPAPRPHAAPAPTPAAAVLPQQAAVVAPAATASASATTQPATRPAAAAAAPSALIAITPDGKLAVFTNPKTKLPQQFKIGDHLPDGSTIRSIDAKAGKVVTSTKEYTFD